MKRGCLLGLLFVAAVGVGLWLTPAGVWERWRLGDSSASDVARLVEEATRLYDAGSHGESASRYAAAARLAGEQGDVEMELKYRAQSAVCFKMAGETERAWEIMLPVLEQARARGDRTTEGLALGNLARLAALRGELDAAVDYLDQLAALARAQGDAVLAVKTLEQAAAALLGRGELDAALARLDDAQVLDPELPEAERRGPALQSLRASVLLERGDDEGALALSAALPETPAVLANRARMLARLGRHAEAAELAVRAGDGFHAEGPLRHDERDRAWILSASEQLAAGDEAGCAERLRLLMSGGGDAQALAPFRIVRARLALRQDRAADAVQDLTAALEAMTGQAAPDELRDVELLACVSALQAGRVEDADRRLGALSPTLGRQLVLATLLMAHPPGDRLATERLAELRPAAARPDDDSLRHLRELVPRPLPSLALATLSCGLADATRLRERKADDAARQVLQEAAADALAWHALETRAAVPGLRDAPGEAEARLGLAAAWARGELPPGEAVVAVLLDDSGAYLLLCLPGSGATAFPLPPPAALRVLEAKAVEGLRSGTGNEMLAATLALTEALLPPAARADLAPHPRWTLLLPDELLGLPPAAWVLDAPRPGEEPRYLVESGVPALRPHVPGLAVPARAADLPWVDLCAPAVDLARVPLAAGAWSALYGGSVLQPVDVAALPGAVALRGEQAGAAPLRSALPAAAVLRLGAPGAGAGRLGGLLLAPSPGAPFVDETGGLLPWHRLPQLPLPPIVLCDGTRFDAGRPGDGPLPAATALLARAGAALLSRWPLPAEVRRVALEDVESLERAGAARARAGGRAPPHHRVGARPPGADSPHRHPRHWAAWLAFGA